MLPVDVRMAAAPDGSDESIAQRLERLERKIDTLLATEALSDLRWRSLDLTTVAPAQSVGTARFVDASKAFADTLDLRRRLIAEKRTPRTLTWTSDDECLWQVDFDRCFDRLQDLALELANASVTTLADIKLKALAVRELAEENVDDPAYRLAVSLAEDLIALKDSA